MINQLWLASLSNTTFSDSLCIISEVEKGIRRTLSSSGISVTYIHISRTGVSNEKLKRHGIITLQVVKVINIEKVSELEAG